MNFSKIAQLFTPPFSRRSAFDGLADFSSLHYQSAVQLARSAPIARPTDSLSLCAENLRTSPYGALPVLVFEENSPAAMVHEAMRGDDATSQQSTHYARLEKEPRGTLRVIGLIEERDLSEALLRAVHHAAQHELTSGEGAFSTMTARDAMRPCFSIPADASLPEALRLLEESGAMALPVCEFDGSYRGLLSRADIVAAMGGALRPPVVGGMATPLGVWLTSGTNSAGAPPLGLFLSGALMGACFVLAHLGVFLAFQALDPTLAQWFSGATSGGEGVSSYAMAAAFSLLETLLFLVLVRFSPLAGFHAAEHQTVWAIERGVPLRADLVSHMPRAHPRCGTNLVALGGLIQLLLGHLPRIAPETVLPALLVIYFAWRRFGTFLQEKFTTRPASPAQMESGLRAGREILEKYQRPAGQNKAASFPAAMLLTAAGLMSVMWISDWLMSLL